MATTSMKRIALDTFITYLATRIPGLAGKIFATPAGPQQTAGCLALVMEAATIFYEPSDEDDVYWDDVTDDNKVVVDVGLFSGRWTMQLFTNSPAERETYEQAILDVFLSSLWSPGTLSLTTPALTVNGYVSPYQAEVKASLLDEVWSDEMAFEAKRFAWIDIQIEFPALTTYDAHTLNIVQVAQADPDLEIIQISDVYPGDVIQVNSDGTYGKPTV